MLVKVLQHLIYTLTLPEARREIYHLATPSDIAEESSWKPSGVLDRNHP